MFKTSPEFLIAFIIISVILILALVVFVITIIYRYKQKQYAYYKDMETIKATHQNELLHSQLEIQEQTFQNISREIHDNIGQKLTLAKLQLNTLRLTDDSLISNINSSVEMISQAISDLSDISRSLSSEIILNNGLIKALEFETSQLQKSGIYQISFEVTGNPIFMESNTELLIFRIVQEALSNVIKHARASKICINLHYNSAYLSLTIEDNGIGFMNDTNKMGTGLQNMKRRALQLFGKLSVESQFGNGTKIIIEIPFKEHKNESNS